MMITKKKTSFSADIIFSDCKIDNKKSCINFFLENLKISSQKHSTKKCKNVQFEFVIYKIEAYTFFLGWRIYCI